MPLTLLLHGRHAGDTVVYEPFGSWIVPWRYTSLDSEYAALCYAVGLIDDSTQALIEVQGADRASFLHNLLTNDIKQLAAGTGCQAALLDASAKLIAEMLVLADQDAIWLLCDLTRAPTILQTLERYLFTEQVTLINHERRQAVLALEGPRAMNLLRAIADSALSELLKIGDHAIVSTQGCPMRIIRYSPVGGNGFLCLIEAERAEAIWELLKQRGQPFGLQLIGWDALNVARIEAGIPWFGIDMDETNLLPETGLEQATVSETKGCYLGQEIIARLQTYGSVNKKLVGLVIDGEEVPRTGDQIVAPESGEIVGHVTSGCYSPTLKRPIAMGYVKRGTYEVRTSVEIRRDNWRMIATVASRPLVSAESDRTQPSCQ